MTLLKNNNKFIEYVIKFNKSVATDNINTNKILYFCTIQ